MEKSTVSTWTDRGNTAPEPLETSTKHPIPPRRRIRKAAFCPRCEGIKIYRGSLLPTPRTQRRSCDSELADQTRSQLRKRITVLEQELALMTTRCRHLTELLTKNDFAENRKFAIDELLHLLKKIQLPIPARVLKRAFLHAADTITEAKTVVSRFAAMEATYHTLRNFSIDSQLQANLNNFDGVRKAFKNRSLLREHRLFLANVFGSNTLRRITNNMVFYSNPLVKIHPGELCFAQADGKYTKCIKPWKQTFELIVTIKKDNKKHRITFAFALLGGTGQQYYKEFFDAVRDMGCPKIPLLIVDFEIGITNAALEVWPDVIVRGCYYHYSTNLLCYRSTIKRKYENEPLPGTTNFLKLVPFLRPVSSYFIAFITDLDLPLDLLFYSPDFKLIAYVYATYVRKLRNIFAIELEELLEKTNNACEGRNSGLSRSFVQRPNIADLAEHLSIKFRTDLVAPKVYTGKCNVFDEFLLLMQQKAPQNIQRIVSFCHKIQTVGRKNGYKLLKAAKRENFDDKLTVSEEDEKEAERRMNEILASYRKFKNDKEKHLREIKSRTLREEQSKLDEVRNQRNQKTLAQEMILEQNESQEAESELSKSKSEEDEFGSDSSQQEGQQSNADSDSDQSEEQLQAIEEEMKKTTEAKFSASELIKQKNSTKSKLWPLKNAQPRPNSS